MTVLRAYIFVLVFGVASLVSAQDTEMTNIRISIKNGNAHGLSTMLFTQVDLKTDQESGAYSKTQAEFILKNFFRKYPPSQFEYNHVGSSPGGAKYMIGTYASGDAVFRVYLKLRVVSGKYLLDNIDFTRQ